MRDFFFWVGLCPPPLLGVIKFKQDLGMIKLGVVKQHVLLDGTQTFARNLTFQGIT